MLTLNYLLYGAAVIILASLIFSIVYIKRQEKKEFDEDVSRTIVKHQILGNPAVLVYIIGFAVLLGLYLLTLIM